MTHRPYTDCGTATIEETQGQMTDDVNMTEEDEIDSAMIEDDELEWGMSDDEEMQEPPSSNGFVLFWSFAPNAQVHSSGVRTQLHIENAQPLTGADSEDMEHDSKMLDMGSQMQDDGGASQGSADMDMGA